MAPTTYQLTGQNRANWVLATIHERHELFLVRLSYLQVLTPATLVDDEDC